jgi:serine/threonine protein phosphatase 1
MSNQIMYAVGDIHGEIGELESAIALIERDARQSRIHRPKIMFLGDYVDRGPDSKAVIERLIELRDVDFGTCIFLRGNHETMMMEGENGRIALGQKWLRLGGDATCRSYGTSTADRPVKSILDDFYRALPDPHRHFIAELKSFHHEGGYFFSHAGVDPGTELADQRESTLLWGSPIFLNHRQPLASIVVHGHYVTEEVAIRRHRIGIDTGCGFPSGRLTAVAFENGACRILSKSA